MDILEQIRKKQAQKLNASHRFEDSRDRMGRQKAETVKDILSGELNKSDITSTVVRDLYYSMVGDYVGQLWSVPKNSPQSKGQWSQIAERVKEAGVTPKKYLKAQFEFYHRCFGRYPKRHELNTAKAVARAKDAQVSKHKTIGVRENKSNFAEMMRTSEQRMQELCRAQDMTREEVYKRFVLTGLFTFPEEFLKADPVYRKLV